MTRLRKMMLDELERRNYSQNTRRLYLHAVSECAQYFHCSPDQLGLDHIRDYQARLFRERKLKPNSVCAYVAALRFFFVHVLKRRWTLDDIPCPKRPHTLPLVLSQDEVAQLINAAANPVHRILLMTLYATGMRRAEVTRLKIADSRNPLLAVYQGAGMPAVLGDLIKEMVASSPAARPDDMSAVSARLRAIRTTLYGRQGWLDRVRRIWQEGK